MRNDTKFETIWREIHFYLQQELDIITIQNKEGRFFYF